jgi:hypothetical protein
VKQVITASIPGARRVLHRQGRYVLGVRGVGFRCTVDKDDVRMNYAPRVLRHTLTSVRSFLRAMTLVNAANLSPALFKDFEQSLGEMDRMLRDLRQGGVDVTKDQTCLDSIKAHFADVDRFRSGN